MEHAKDTSQKTNLLDPLIKKIPEYGQSYLDAKSFNDIDELPPFSKSLLQYRIIKISLYHGFYQYDLHGIQITYKNLETGKIFNSSLRSKKHYLTRCQTFELDHSEYISKVEVITDSIIEKLSFHTTKLRTISCGTSNNAAHTYPTDDSVVVGTYGAYSDQGLYSLGLYVAPITEVRYWKRRTYLLMRAAISKHMFLQEKAKILIKQDSEDDDYDDDSRSEKAFALLCMSSQQTFVRVLRFL